MMPGHVDVWDDVLEKPLEYRASVLTLPFRTYDFPNCSFHGIAVGGPSMGLLEKLHDWYPTLEPTTTFFRKSPLGQVEPNYIHSDIDMGDWTAVLYLSPESPEGDGTVFWTHRATGEVGNMTPHLRSEEGRDAGNWDIRQMVRGTFNRMVVFPSHYYHSRAIHENWGDGPDARLVQVVFGKGKL
jgi:hypothetical protein